MARAGTGRARAVDELKCDAVIKKKSESQNQHREESIITLPGSLSWSGPLNERPLLILRRVPTHAQLGDSRRWKRQCGVRWIGSHF